MPFKPGQSGNPGGSAFDKAYTNSLRASVNKLDPKTKRRKLELATDRVADAAAYEGSLQAAMHIGDRLDGKPHQTQDLNVNRTTVTEMTRDELLRIAAQDRVESQDEETKH